MPDHTEDTDVARVVPVEADSVTVTVVGPVDVSVAVPSCVVVKNQTLMRSHRATLTYESREMMYVQGFGRAIGTRNYSPKKYLKRRKKNS